MAQSLKEEIFEIVKTMPGSVAGDIRQLTSKPTGNSVYSLLSALVQQGALRTEEGPLVNNRPVRIYFIGDGQPPAFRRKPASPKQTASGEAATCAILREEIAELKAWKEAAIRRYPDLAVDPLVLKARQIVSAIFADQGDAVQAAHALEGKLDKRPIMLATLSALEN